MRRKPKMTPITPAAKPKGEAPPIRPCGDGKCVVCFVYHVLPEKCPCCGDRKGKK